MDRFTHNGYAMVKNDYGSYVFHSDHAAEMTRLEDDYLKLNNIACELRTRAERAEAYVDNQWVHSDFKTAREMREALDLARAELARVEKLLDAARDAARVAIDQMDVWQRACSAASVMHTKTLADNALLRAECDAARECWIICNHEYTISGEKVDALAAARAATDAAGILKGGES